MTVWNQIREEFQDSQHKNIRLKYMRQYVKHTGRNLLIYASDFISGSKPGHLTMIDNGDKNIFADTIRSLDASKGLDCLIESPGGIGSAAESIALMLRSRFESVRFIVPNMAKSAATILCLSGDEILMNEQSELGPIDPQMPIRQPNGDLAYSPAHIILQQFSSLLATVSKEPATGKILAPYLQVYFPSLLQECHNSIRFSQVVAERLLSNYMFRNEDEKQNLSKFAAQKLSDFANFLSHGRALNIDYTLNELNLKVFDLRTDPKLDVLVNQIYISIKETFNRNPSIVKICESHKGHGTLKRINIIRA